MHKNNEVRHVKAKADLPLDLSLDLPLELSLDLSGHFTLAEAMHSRTAQCRGINNKPPAELAPALMRVAVNILEPCRAHFGTPFSPTSWYRCIELNIAIGGSKASQHVKGEAVDFKIRGVSNYELARHIRDTLDFDQLILEYWDPACPSDGWVHCSYVSPKKNRKQCLHFDGSYHTGLGD